MLALLPFFALIGFFVLFDTRNPTRLSVDRDWRDSLGFALIAWGAGLAISSEILGALHILNRTGVLLFWGSVLLVVSFFLIRRPHFPTISRLRLGWSHVRRFDALDRLLLVSLLTIFVLTFLTAVSSPPQEGDALAYHMGRVMHWLQNETLAPYATPDSRQIWMPPWTEFGFAHLFLLAGTDRLVNLIQWIAMAGSVLLVTRIASLLGAGVTGQILSGLFLATIPVGISQASGALTDYALAMWVVVLIWLFLFLEANKFSKGYWLLLGFALGCGVLTKTNFVVFAIPLMLFLEWDSVKKMKWGEWIGNNALMAVIAFALVLPSWLRTYRGFGSILGVEEHIDLHRNLNPWMLTIFSDYIRTLSMRLATPLDSVNALLYKGVYFVHEHLGVLPSDPSITYQGKSYFVDWAWPGEDAAAVHTVLLSLAVLFYFIRRKPKVRTSARRLLFMTMLSYGFYAVLFKWQGNARFYLAFYASAAAPVGCLLGAWRRRWMQSGGVALLMLTALPVLVSHHTRPLVPLPPRTVTQSVLLADRERLVFRENEAWFASHRAIADRVVASGCSSVGLRIDSSDLEYPWWVVLRPFERDIRIEHLLIYPGLEAAADPSFDPCVIICAVCDEDDQRLAGLELQEVINGIYLYR